jgi:nucleotide-binding universal stress UspA family protein
MLSYAHVLVPTDGSPLAARAFPVARAVAERLGARTAVVSVASTEVELDRHGPHVAEAAAALRAREEDRWMVNESTPAKGIALVAEELRRPLVCMSSHGHGRSAAMLGSVAQDVLLALGAPVVLVGPMAALGPVDAPVVVTVDGSEASEAAIAVGREWAARLDAELRVVTVFEPVPEPISGRPARRAHGPQGDVDAYLADLARRIGGEGGPPVEAVAVGDPIGAASGLRSWLPEHPAQLLACTTHARTGLSRVVVGSTTAQLVHASPVPVLVVPPTS